MAVFTKKTIITIAGFASIFVAISVNSILLADQKKMPPPAAKTTHPIVSVTQVSPVSKQAKITAYGEVT